MTKVQCTLLMHSGWRAVGELKMGWGNRMNLHSWVPHSIPSYLKNFTLLKKSLEEFCV
uniref:Macaca fascicularis brain cDNA, clone: QtrA-19063 n=2 Tax=Macaca TaxID=9539 RepID=I7GF77_MACFA|nr:unnamed protein product [Macaca fascicularis]